MSHSTHLRTLARRVAELASMPYSKALQEAQAASARKQLILPLTDTNIEKNAQRLAAKISKPQLRKLPLGLDQNGSMIELDLKELNLHLLATGSSNSGLGKFNSHLIGKTSEQGWDTILISSSPQGPLPLGRRVSLQNASLWSSLNLEQLIESTFSLLLPKELYLGTLVEQFLSQATLDEPNLGECILSFLKRNDAFKNEPSINISYINKLLSQNSSPLMSLFQPGHSTLDISELDEIAATKEVNALLSLLVTETRNRMVESPKTKPNRILVVINPFSLASDHLSSALLSRARAAGITLALTGEHIERVPSQDITNNIGSLFTFGESPAPEVLGELTSRFGAPRTKEDIESLKPSEYYFSNTRTGIRAKILLSA